MPDTKLTWANLRTHFRKWAVVYAVVVIASVLLADLLWTTTTPQLPDERQVLIFLAAPFSNPAPLHDLAGEMLAAVQADHPELARVEFQSLPFPGPDSGDSYIGPMVLMSRLATGEADAFLADSNATAALAQAGACLPLDERVAAGWLSGYGLEPFYTTSVDPATGQTTAVLSALRLDGLPALMELGAFDHRGACLVIAANGRNIDSTLDAVAVMVEKLSREGKQS